MSGAAAAGRLRFLGLPLRLARALRRRAAARPLIARLCEPVDDLLDVLFEQSGTGMAVVDRGGLVVRVNPALARMGGGAAPGRPAPSLFLPEHRDAVWGELRPVLDGTEAARPFVARLPGPDDGHHVRVLPAALREADGACGGLVLRLYDITVQTRLEARLADGERLRAVGQLAAGVAHDFNNLLTPVLGVADEALARADLPPGLADDLRLIRGGADRGAALVRKLLAVGGQQALLPRALALNGAVRDLSGLLRRMLGAKLRLELELEEPGPVVRADPVQLDRVLVNLAANARDAMSGVPLGTTPGGPSDSTPGGGRVWLRTGRTVLAEALVLGGDTLPAGTYATVEVADEGPGIPPDILPRVFDPFFTTRRERGGSGLGLAAAHGIVRQSGGFITAESRVGRGTCMRVHLPLHDALHDGAAQGGASRETPRDRDAAPRAAPPGRPGAGRAVLLVEDEDAVRGLVERALRGRGWRVLAAESAEDALALLAGQGGAGVLDLAVSDVALPGMDGPALLRALRREKAGLPAILASGHADARARAEAAALGVPVLQKPYTPRALVAQADALLDAAGASTGAPRFT